WRVELSEPCEALLLPLSGGVLAKAPAINLPRRALNLAERLDRAVSRRWPRLLALGRRVVLRKRS
ncbi:MAG: class I SAM-dependent methyltransferase, partial [Elusimicrobia bacterium]|nr:class I SAM-dependent methyltransferase [Elusimicrobiota bacterium]